jgi:hypothetical protein
MPLARAPRRSRPACRTPPECRRAERDEEAAEAGEAVATAKGIASRIAGGQRQRPAERPARRAPAGRNTPSRTASAATSPAKAVAPGQAMASRAWPPQITDLPKARPIMKIVVRKRRHRAEQEGEHELDRRKRRRKAPRRHSGRCRPRSAGCREAGDLRHQVHAGRSDIERFGGEAHRKGHARSPSCQARRRAARSSASRPACRRTSGSPRQLEPAHGLQARLMPSSFSTACCPGTSARRGGRIRAWSAGSPPSCRPRLGSTRTS